VRHPEALRSHQRGEEPALTEVEGISRASEPPKRATPVPL